MVTIKELKAIISKLSEDCTVEVEYRDDCRTEVGNVKSWKHVTMADGYAVSETLLLQVD